MRTLKHLSLVLISLFLNINLYNVLAGPSNNNQDGKWELSKSKDGVLVYTRDKAGVDIKEFMATTIIDTKMEKLVKIIGEVDKYPQWIANTKSVDIIKKVSDTEQISYTVIDVPWPLDLRDAVYQSNNVIVTDSIFEQRIVVIPKVVAEKEDIVRIKNSKGRWVFKEKSPGKIQVIYQMYADPEGNVPNWMVNLFIVDGPFETLQNLRKRCAN